MSALNEQAHALGIDLAWRGNDGLDHQVPKATIETIVGLMGGGNDHSYPPPHLALPGKPVTLHGVSPGLPYRIKAEDGELGEGRTKSWRGKTILDARPAMGLYELLIGDNRHWLLVAPDRCLSPMDIGIERSFGITAQLYGMRGRSADDLGDFGDLDEAAGLCAAEGADFLGLNPLHALFSADPSASSPYSPSSRRFLNPFYIDPDQALIDLGLELPPPSPPADGELVDYQTAGTRRLARLRQLFERMGDHPDLERFRRVGGKPLQTHALFEAMHKAALDFDPDRWAFWDWPEGWQPSKPPAQAFAMTHRRELDFHVFLQWLAECQLAKAHTNAKSAGMRLGLYRDLAVGVNPAGSMVWANPKLALRGVSIGAPPDAFSPLGQTWGLAPFAPNALAAQGFGPLLADLEANARHAGALRIDHVIGLARQFWVPDGYDATHGAYIRFPFDVIARLAALVSHRNQCLIIGEDLGTVPPGFRRKLERYNMLSCRLLYFEREGKLPRAPECYPGGALASISTHDLPTVSGFMAGKDIDWRAKLKLFPDQAAEQQARTARAGEIQDLHQAATKAEIEETEPALYLHRLLARTKSALTAVQIEDLEGTVEQANLPGTVDTHPNWRRRMAKPIKELLRSKGAQAILEIMRQERPR